MEIKSKLTISGFFDAFLRFGNAVGAGYSFSYIAICSSLYTDGGDKEGEKEEKRARKPHYKFEPGQRKTGYSHLSESKAPIFPTILRLQSLRQVFWRVYYHSKK